MVFHGPLGGSHYGSIVCSVDRRKRTAQSRDRGQVASKASKICSTFVGQGIEGGAQRLLKHIAGTYQNFVTINKLQKVLAVGCPVPRRDLILIYTSGLLFSLALYLWRSHMSHAWLARRDGHSFIRSFVHSFL